MHVRAELDVLTEADENDIYISIHLYASLSLSISGWSRSTTLIDKHIDIHMNRVNLFPFV